MILKRLPILDDRIETAIEGSEYYSSDWKEKLNMNTKEASARWGCDEKVVREYCKSGIIPAAYKNGLKWVIPDDIRELPPVTAKKAVYLMKCIEEDILPGTGKYWNEDKMVDALLYLSDMRFILDYEGHSTLEEAAKKCRVSGLGKELIKKTEEKAGKNKIGVKGSFGFEKGLPTGKIEIGVEHGQ